MCWFSSFLVDKSHRARGLGLHKYCTVQSDPYKEMRLLPKLLILIMQTLYFDNFDTTKPYCLWLCSCGHLRRDDQRERDLLPEHGFPRHLQQVRCRRPPCFFLCRGSSHTDSVLMHDNKASNLWKPILLHRLAEQNRHLEVFNFLRIKMR
jgi:hypothetical protein